MKGITFGDVHSYNDLHLILSSKEIGSPAVKTRKIEVEGADGALDLTDFFGEPKYEDVQHKFEFSTVVPKAEFLSLFSTIKNTLHGKKMRIILDDDPLFYYLGRVSVSGFTNDKNIGHVSITADCEPYKYKVEKTRQFVSLSGKNLFDNQMLVPLLRAAANYSSTDTGVQITTEREGRYPYVMFKILPSAMLSGKTITISFTVNSEATDRYIVVLGLSDNTGHVFRKIKETSSENNVTIDIPHWITEQYENVVVWFYSGKDVEAPVDSYVVYTDIQIEISDTATEYVPFESEEKTFAISVQNSRKKVVPQIMASRPIIISKDGSTSALAAETVYTIPEFELSEGDNLFTVTGTGAVSITYQEGVL